MSALLSFLQTLQTLSPDALFIRYYDVAQADTIPHYPDWHCAFADTGLYLYVGYGSAVFRVWNEDLKLYLTVGCNNLKKNGKIENETISYRNAEYRNQVQTIFDSRRHALGEFVVQIDPPGLIDGPENEYRVQIPLLITDIRVINNLTLIGELLPGLDCSALLQQRDEHGYISLSAVIAFLESGVSIPREPLTVGMQSVIEIDALVVAEPQQTTLYKDVHFNNTPDYLFDLHQSCRLEELEALLAPISVSKLLVDNQCVASIVRIADNSWVVDAAYQIIQNPTALDHWIFEQKLTLSDGSNVSDFFAGQSFQSDLPERLLEWVRVKVQECIEGQGDLKTADGSPLKANILFTDAFKFLSLREFHSDNPKLNQYVNDILIRNFEQYKNRFQVARPQIEETASRNAAWHLWSKCLERASDTISVAPKQIQILNEAQFRYAQSSGFVQKNILIRFDV